MITKEQLQDFLQATGAECMDCWPAASQWTLSFTQEQLYWGIACGCLFGLGQFLAIWQYCGLLRFAYVGHMSLITLVFEVQDQLSAEALTKITEQFWVSEYIYLARHGWRCSGYCRRRFFFARLLLERLMTCCVRRYSKFHRREVRQYLLRAARDVELGAAAEAPPPYVGGGEVSAATL